MQDQPTGLCECGCGAEASPGRRFVIGHHARLSNWREVEQEIRDRTGVCECGCGGAIRIATATSRTLGRLKGYPVARFISGHNLPAARDPAERFFEMVDKDGPIPAAAPRLGPCWVWIGTISHQNYGLFTVNQRYTRAHRWSYRHVYGAVPRGLVLDHLCRNTRCVNPTHLEAVTQGENTRRGSLAKLTSAMASEIRAIPASVTHVEVARRFGVNASVISRVRGGKAWVS